MKATYLSLIQAPDDPALEDRGYQLELSDFRKFAESSGVDLGPAIGSNAFGGGGSLPSIDHGAYYILWDHVAKTILPTVPALLGGALGAWLHARYGRKVRLEIGDVEAEAQSREEVEKLIAHALEIQQNNQLKRIQEP